MAPKKKRKAIKYCLNKRITADISYQRRQALFIASNDTKGCYDRIHHVVGTLVLMRFGVPWKVCAVLFEVLKCSKYSIQTAYSTAPNMYGGLHDDLNSSGQGNSLGPALWAIISSCLIELMEWEGHGVTWQSALSLTVNSLVYFAFVDDTDLTVTAPTYYSSRDDLAHTAQHELNTWTQAL